MACCAGPPPRATVSPRPWKMRSGDARRRSDGRKALLRAPERGGSGEQPHLFARIAVADHDFLHAAVTECDRGKRGRRAAGFKMAGLSSSARSDSKRGTMSRLTLLLRASPDAGMARAAQRGEHVLRAFGLRQDERSARGFSRRAAGPRRCARARKEGASRLPSWGRRRASPDRRCARRPPVCASRARQWQSRGRARAREERARAARPPRAPRADSPRRARDPLRARPRCDRRSLAWARSRAAGSAGRARDRAGTVASEAASRVSMNFSLRRQGSPSLRESSSSSSSGIRTAIALDGSQELGARRGVAARLRERAAQVPHGCQKPAQPARLVGADGIVEHVRRDEGIAVHVTPHPRVDANRHAIRARASRRRLCSKARARFSGNGGKQVPQHLFDVPGDVLHLVADARLLAAHFVGVPERGDFFAHIAGGVVLFRGRELATIVVLEDVRNAIDLLENRAPRGLARMRGERERDVERSDGVPHA